MNEPIVFLGGEYIPASRASIALSDLGFIMGATFTEMTRTFGHQLFRAEDHIQRLFHSLAYGGVELPHPAGRVLEITREVVAHNCKLIGEGAELAAVHFVTPGENQMYAGTGSGLNLQPTFGVHTFPLPFAKWRPLFKSGAHCITPEVRHIPPQSIDPRVKHRSRLHWWLAERAVHEADPAGLSLLLDEKGHITESAGANFLMVQGRTVLSPRSDHILGGISLRTVQEIAVELDLEWVERDLKVQDVLRADEAWLTSTPYCIAPCTCLNDKPIGNGTIGPLYQQVLECWSKRVGLDIRAQIGG